MTTAAPPLIERVSKERAAVSKTFVINTAIVVSAILIALTFRLLTYGLSIGAETALNLQCGLLITEGKVPYIDFFDVSAPWLMYLYAIPAGLSAVTLFHPIQVFNVFVVLMAAASYALCGFILLQANTRERAHVPFVLAGLALLNFLFLVEFGQREHLFLLLYMPLFFCRWLSWSNQQPSKTYLRIIAGLCGGVAACLDPLFLLALLAMELYYWLGKLKFAPLLALEIRTVLCVVAVYYLHFMMFPPDYGSTYFKWALPMVLGDYKFWDDRLVWVQKTPDRRDLVYFMVIACTAALGMRRWCTLLTPCVALAIVGFGLYVIQGKMLTFQALPMLYGAVLSVCLLCSICLNYIYKSGFIKSAWLKPKLVAALSVVALIGSCYLTIKSTSGLEPVDLKKLGYIGRTYGIEEASYTTYMERDTKPGEPVLVINDRVRPAYPLLLQLGRQPATFLLTGYPLRMVRLLTEREPEKLQEYNAIQFQMHERLVKEFDRVRPKLVMLEQDSLGSILIDSKLMTVVNEHYEEVGHAEFPDSYNEQQFEYLGFRTPLTVFKLKRAK